MAHMPTVVFLLLLQLSLHVRADKREPKIIQPGSSLSATTQPSSWTSSSGHFQFGFYPQGNGFALGIWIVGHRQDDFTVVWTVNRDDPPLSSNATLDFTKRGDLIVRDGIYGRNISEPYYPGDSASMLDSGNFVLYSNKSVVWESFDFPTDTILGGQNLSSGDALISIVSSLNHSGGQYVLRVQNDGNLVAYVNNSAEIDYTEWVWESHTSGFSFNGLNLNEEGRLLLYGYSTTKVLASSSRVGDKAGVIYRATLDPDGIFRLYSHEIESKTGSTSNGTKIWQNLDDPCDVYSVCGLNSYCSNRGGDVECYCYPGFTFTDENMKSLGCSQNSSSMVACEERKDQAVVHYNITILDNMTWTGDLYSSVRLKEEECRKNCEQDCYCGGVLYSNGKCNKYSLPLKYGRRRENVSTTAFIKVYLGIITIGNGTPDHQSSPTPIFANEGNRRLISTMGISLGSVACLCLLIAMSSFLIYKHRVQSYRKLFENKNTSEQFTLQSFSFSELEKATDGFKEELGKGSFGAVYKGILQGDNDSNKTIAVKKLDKVNERDQKEFRTEMTVIGRRNHRNLVRLLGFCMEGSRKLLVYEYLSNGSLANFLFKVNKERLIWKDRARIALDVARGILYLHEECEVCIIHCNIKPQNILLDDFMTAKISDFGLAKLWRPNQTSITGIKGPTRYSATEWQRNAPLSVKVDVYSFGVVLLEIICCRSSIEVEVSSADEILLSTWVYNCFVAGELYKLVEGEEVDMKMLERFVKVGLWCIQDDPTLRPLMKNVTLMLEGTMDVPVPPSPSLPLVTPINCQ